MQEPTDEKTADEKSDYDNNNRTAGGRRRLSITIIAAKILIVSTAHVLVIAIRAGPLAVASSRGIHHGSDELDM
ncbi:hypothetical protein EDD21DRAFT_446182 [Dissophora ornata]|nr:hypothetical protein EDD21DRAFT_446182 [Dissophora ornata]